MDAPAFEGLKASIRRSGVLEPIVLYGGAILDGRHRYRAAMELGLRLGATEFREFVGTEAEAEAYADAVNAHRRHLTAGQREARVRTYLANHPGASHREAARACGVSHHTVTKHRRCRPSERKYQRLWRCRARRANRTGRPNIARLRRPADRAAASMGTLPTA